MRLFHGCGCQPCVITVTGDEAEAADRHRVEDIHRIDDHGAVGCVLADRIAKLLDRLHGKAVECIFPTTHVRFRPIAINTTDGHGSIFTCLGDHQSQQRRLGVIAVDQHRHTLVAAENVGQEDALSKSDEERCDTSRYRYA